MRTTITGASGLIGNNLAKQLVEAGHTVVAANRFRSRALDDLDVEYVETDVLDPDSLRLAIEGSDVVFHLAALISIVGDPTGMVQRVNVEGPRNVARICHELGVGRLVHTSSVHAFDLAACGPSLDETGPRTTSERSPVYDRTKFAGEQEVRAVIDDGLDAVIVNPTGVFGPRDFARSRVNETIRELRSGRIPVTLTGGFDFVDVRDVVEGTVAALEWGRTGENYLLSGTRLSIRELADLVAGIVDGRKPLLDIPLGLMKPLASLVETVTPSDRVPLITRESLHALEYSPAVSHHKATVELGYSPRPIHESVADTIDWLDANVDRPDGDVDGS